MDGLGRKETTLGESRTPTWRFSFSRPYSLAGIHPVAQFLTGTGVAQLCPGPGWHWASGWTAEVFRCLQLRYAEVFSKSRSTQPPPNPALFSLNPVFSPSPNSVILSPRPTQSFPNSTLSQKNSKDQINSYKLSPKNSIKFLKDFLLRSQYIFRTYIVFRTFFTYIIFLLYIIKISESSNTTQFIPILKIRMTVRMTFNDF